MSSYAKAMELLEFIESKNTHGRKTFLAKMVELGLTKTIFYVEVGNATTNIGKNQLKDIWLKAFISNMQTI